MRVFVSMLFILSISFSSGCAVQKHWAATGGSRADATVRISFDYTAYEVPEVDDQEGINLAEQRCQSWGYTGAEAFGGIVKQCMELGRSGCDRWMVTKEFQCTGTGSVEPKKPAAKSKAVKK